MKVFKPRLTKETINSPENNAEWKQDFLCHQDMI